MEIYQIYAGGKFVSSSKILMVFNPFTGNAFAQTYLADKSILEEAICKAEEVRPLMKALPSYQKYAILMEIASEMKKDEVRLAQVLAQEACKPYKYASGEIARAIQTFIVAAEESKRLPSEYISLDWTPAGAGKEGLVKYFPVGLVAGIAPFNFPINLAVHKIAPAIAAGCPIILKPASSTPLSTLELAKIINRTSLPKGAVSILPMDRITGNLLVTDQRFKLLTFTGSPDIGWKMKEDAGKKKVVLELGGNAGVIVTKSCNIDIAVAKCVAGGFAYSGQVCIHAQRIYIDKDIFNEFSEKFVNAVKLLKVGDPLNADTDISSMIDEANAVRVGDWINDAVADGAKILCGGNRKAAFVEPTVLINTKKQMNVCSKEVFGPVVILESYNNFKEAIELINDSVYGLQAGVFTNNNDEIDCAFNELEVGGVIINDVPTFRVDHMPYGGIKDSGLGREGIKYAIMDMMEAKILVKSK